VRRCQTVAVTGTTYEESTRRSRPRLSDEIRDALARDLLLSGALNPGDRMPTEAELCRRYNASRVTVRSALRSLQEAGFIAIRQGAGSTVLPRAQTIPSGLDQLSSLETFAADQGAVVWSTQLEVIERELDEMEADKLERSAGSEALVIRRVKVYDNDPVAWIVDYVPVGVMPFSALREEFTGSVLDILLAHSELDVQYSDCEVAAGGLPIEVAERLDAPEGTPAMYLDELTRTSRGEIVNWSQAWLLPQYFTFSIRRRRRFS
jgi:DNA-binding GntR family transcriptional regulator